MMGERWWRRISVLRENVAGRRGALGERLAAARLKKSGLKIVARNWRSPRDQRDEIDLVCLEGEVLVFVEVKTRAAGALVSGYYAVDRHKKKVLRRAADAYLRALKPADRPTTFRFDVVEVELGAEVIIRHFENVPLFEKDYGF
jgi:putative endonuclease